MSRSRASAAVERPSGYICPGRRPASGHPAGLQPQPAAAAEGETVLVVEDDPDVRQSVMATLGTFPVFAKPYRQRDLARKVRRLMTSKAG
jgi:hypothetical protein